MRASIVSLLAMFAVIAAVAVLAPGIAGALEVRLSSRALAQMLVMALACLALVVVGVVTWAAVILTQMQIIEPAPEVEPAPEPELCPSLLTLPTPRRLELARERVVLTADFLERWDG